MVAFLFNLLHFKSTEIIVVNGGSNAMDKDTKHIKDRSTGTEGYLEYAKENEKGKVNQLDVGNPGRYSTLAWTGVCRPDLGTLTHV